MPDALKTRDLPDEMARREAFAVKRQERIDTREAKKADESRTKMVREKHGPTFKGKKFKNLTPQQKDRLLKAIAVQLGLLDDDNDD